MIAGRRTDTAAAAVAFFAGALVGALVELLGAVLADRAHERQAIAHALDELDELGGADSRASVAEWGAAGLAELVRVADRQERAIAAAEVASDVALIVRRREATCSECEREVYPHGYLMPGDPGAGHKPDCPKVASGPAAHARAVADGKRTAPGPGDTPEPAGELSEPESAS